MTPVTATGTPRSPYSLTDDLVESAETQELTYHCPAGHSFVIRLFAEAEEVPVAGRVAASRKTPWQQLRERRTIAELETLLVERLRLLRAHQATAAAA